MAEARMAELRMANRDVVAIGTSAGGVEAIFQRRSSSLSIYQASSARPLIRC